ncbi:MAG: FG-GAP repeat protein, partial [Myxococcales bacterium]|nr:FG-GAP repeat protein [Myxococcales bacterium]
MTGHSPRMLGLVGLILAVTGACSIDDAPPIPATSTAPLTKVAAAPPPDPVLVEHQLRSVLDDPLAVRGDFDGDGQPELAVGDPSWDQGSVANTGRVLVYATTGCGDTADPTPHTILRPGSGGLVGTALSWGRFGYALVVGDFNNDGYDDLAVGMPGRSGSTQTYGGAVYVIPGSSHGLRPTSAVRFDQDDFFTPFNGPPTQNHDQMDGGEGFGFALAAGDANADAYDDLAVGVPFEGRYGLSEAGVVHVVYGASGGIGPGLVQTIDRAFQTIGKPVHAGDRFGYQVAIGHFRFAKAPTLVISAPGADDAGASTGTVHFLRGSTGGYGLNSAAMFNENAPGFASSPTTGERFGQRLILRREDADPLDDLVIETRSSSDCGGDRGRHLMVGSSTGITAVGDYACGETPSPRFALDVAPPRPPEPLSTPSNATWVNSAEELEDALHDVNAKTILVGDGTYELDHYVVVNAPHVVWAEHTGAAILRFGIRINYVDWPTNVPLVLRGLVFEALPGSTSFPEVPTPPGTTATTDSVAVLTTPFGDKGVRYASLTVEHCLFYGHGELGYAIRVARPHHLLLDRLRIRDVRSTGIYVTGNAAGVQKPPSDIEVIARDLDIAGVFRPDGTGGIPGEPTDALYYCNNETGLVITDIEEAYIDRVRVRDTRCTGIGLMINRWETPGVSGHVRDLDVDCAGFHPPTLSGDQQLRPVRNAGIYLQDSSLITLERLWVGKHTYDGLRSEHPDPDSLDKLTPNESVTISDGLFQAARLGISLDGCTEDFLLQDFTIEEASCAGVYDPTWSDAQQCPQALPNHETGGYYDLASGVPH